MTRTTQRQLNATFARFCAAYKLPVSGPGAYFLDHAPAYGGWQVRQTDEDGGSGEHTPFGFHRYSAGELWQTLSFALDLAHIIGAPRALLDDPRDD